MRTPSPSVEATPAASPHRAPASPVINLAVRCVHPAPPEPPIRTYDQARPRLRRPSSTCATAHLFRPISTGKERDTETGLDDFGARYYASVMGRFMTPDWAAKPTAVPYASFGDPQTLNLYSYVENGPLNRVDADGHVAGLVAYNYMPHEGYGELGVDQAYEKGEEEKAYEDQVEEAFIESEAHNAAAAQQQMGPDMSHLEPMPKGTVCGLGTICEGNKIRVGDYNGETYCDGSGCRVWHGDGDGHGWWGETAPNNASVSATPPAPGPKKYTGLDWWKAYGTQIVCELTTQVTGNNPEIFLGGSIAAAGGAATGGAGYIVTGGFGGAIVGNAARIRSQCVRAAWGVGHH